MGKYSDMAQRLLDAYAESQNYLGTGADPSQTFGAARQYSQDLVRSMPGMGFAHGAGYTANFGNNYAMPESFDEGPSIVENFQNGNFKDAGWQGLGLVGDGLLFGGPALRAASGAVRAGGKLVNNIPMPEAWATGEGMAGQAGGVNFGRGGPAARRAANKRAASAAARANEPVPEPTVNNRRVDTGEPWPKKLERREPMDMPAPAEEVPPPIPVRQLGGGPSPEMAAAQQALQNRQDANREYSVRIQAAIGRNAARDEFTGPNDRRAEPRGPSLQDAIDMRSSQMKLPEAKRQQPVEGDALLPTGKKAYEKGMIKSKGPIYVPRLEPGKKYPQNERAKVIDDNRELIAERLAELGRPYVGDEAQYFYHLRGPLLAATKKAGISDSIAKQWFKDFAAHYAATSPQTPTTQNLRNATIAMAKSAKGEPLRSILGEGTGGMGDSAGVAEHGYPMFLGDSGVSGQLLDDVARKDGIPGPGINKNNNTKPATFEQNILGNFDGATIDIHAIRAVLDALNHVKPGSIPLEYILPEYHAAYKRDPTRLNPANWLRDEIESTSTNKVSKQVEYGPFSDVYRSVGKRLKIKSAEAQAVSWFGNGLRTGLKSKNASLATLFNEQLSVTARLLKITPEEVLRLIVKHRRIPFLSAGAVPLATGGGKTNDAQAQGMLSGDRWRPPGKYDDIAKQMFGQ